MATILIKKKGNFPIYQYNKIQKKFSLFYNNLDFKPLSINCSSFDQNGIELQLVYKIRNKFAHGDFQFPEAPNYSFKNPKNLIWVIDLSSKIILLHMQSLLIHSIPNNLIHFYFDAYFDNVDIDELPEKISSSYLLSRIHLKGIPETDKLYTLFNKYYFNL